MLFTMGCNSNSATYNQLIGSWSSTDENDITIRFVKLEFGADGNYRRSSKTVFRDFPEQNTTYEYKGNWKLSGNEISVTQFTGRTVKAGGKPEEESIGPNDIGYELHWRIHTISPANLIISRMDGSSTATYSR